MKTFITIALVSLFAMAGQTQANEGSKVKNNAFIEQARISMMVKQKLTHAREIMNADYTLLEQAGMDTVIVAFMKKVNHKKLDQRVSEARTVIAFGRSVEHLQN